MTPVVTQTSRNFWFNLLRMKLSRKSWKNITPTAWIFDWLTRFFNCLGMLNCAIRFIKFGLCLIRDRFTSKNVWSNLEKSFIICGEPLKIHSEYELPHSHKIILQSACLIRACRKGVLFCIGWNIKSDFAKKVLSLKETKIIV